MVANVLLLTLRVFVTLVPLFLFHLLFSWTPLALPIRPLTGLCYGFLPSLPLVFCHSARVCRIPISLVSLSSFLSHMPVVTLCYYLSSRLPFSLSLFICHMSFVLLFSCSLSGLPLRILSHLFVVLISFFLSHLPVALLSPSFSPTCPLCFSLLVSSPAYPLFSTTSLCMVSPLVGTLSFSLIFLLYLPLLV